MTIIVTTESNAAVTALDIIKRALRLLGVYSKGESPSSDETTDALAVLNGIMGAISNTSLVYAKTLDVIALTAGVASLTVGPFGSTSAARPLKVLDESYITNGTVSYPLVVLTQQQYSDIPTKATQGIPQTITPLMAMPDVQLTLWPVPIAGLTLNLWSLKQLATFPGLTTAVSLPPGYDDALGYLLAEALAPEYQVEPSPTVQRLIKRARRDIEEMNLEVPMLKTSAPTARAYFNVLTNR